MNFDSFDIHNFLVLMLGGLTKGSIYALIALGYTMVYGIVQLINFAHGEIYMLGTFIGLAAAALLSFTGFPLLAILVITIIVAIIWSAAYGFTMEKVAYRPIRSAPRLSPLISAIGMSIFLQSYVSLAQTTDFQVFKTLVPDFDFLDPISDILPSTAFVIIVTSFFVMLVLSLFIKFTKMGKAMRATAQNRTMAMLLGINPDTVISVTFIIGSGLAALAGVLIASHVGQTNFTVGFMAGLKAFTAAVLGGIGSIPGAMLGGIVLGLCESFGAGYISSSYEDVFAFAILILILLLRPAGLLGKAPIQKV